MLLPEKSIESEGDAAAKGIRANETVEEQVHNVKPGLFVWRTGWHRSSPARN
jgi:hypothetical protein